MTFIKELIALPQVWAGEVNGELPEVLKKTAEQPGVKKEDVEPQVKPTEKQEAGVDDGKVVCANTEPTERPEASQEELLALVVLATSKVHGIGFPLHVRSNGLCGCLFGDHPPRSRG